MSDRVIVIDENNVTVDGIAYKTVVSDVLDCDKCAFYRDEHACSKVPFCAGDSRKDGNVIIWVTAV